MEPLFKAKVAIGSVKRKTPSAAPSRQNAEPSTPGDECRPGRAEPRPQRLLALCARRLALHLCAFGVIWLAGCVGTSAFLHWGEQKPYGEPCRVVAAWNPVVVSTPDPVHDGALNPGLAGRIYLFGPEIGCPMLGDGSLHVALYDDSQGPAAKDAAPLEEWHFDAATLKRLEHRDPVGWGYTIFLPWGSYRPDIVHIHLKVRYEPAHGFPLFAASAPMTLVDPEKTDRWESSVAHVIHKGDAVATAGSAAGVPAPAPAVAAPPGP